MRLTQWIELRLPAFAAVAGATAIIAFPAGAHHGGGVEWQNEVLGPITGTATDFEFTFPHVVLHMDVEQGGGTQAWAVVTRWTPTILRRLGWTRRSIEPGDTVTITYRPHLSDSAVAFMQSIEVNGEPLPLDQ